MKTKTKNLQIRSCTQIFVHKYDIDFHCINSFSFFFLFIFSFIVNISIYHFIDRKFMISFSIQMYLIFIKYILFEHRLNAIIIDSRFIFRPQNTKAKKKNNSSMDFLLSFKCNFCLVKNIRTNCVCVCVSVSVCFTFDI